MLFLLRTAFWLMIIVLLLPTDERQRSEVYGTAQAAVHDLATFCDRNPETCAKGKDAFGVLVQKAQFGARMLIDEASGSVDVRSRRPSGSTEGSDHHQCNKKMFHNSPIGLHLDIDIAGAA